jgi:hypothetical protein
MVFLALCACGKSQVGISTNLLRTIPLNKSLTFEVRISKGAFNNFSRYQMEVPEGITIAEVESNGGTFSFEENKVKIIWVVAPADQEFAIRMKLRPVREATKGVISFKYYYMEQDDKREFEAKPFVITFKDTVLPVFLSAPMLPLESKNPPPLPIAEVNTATVSTKQPEHIKQQVKQLRKDSHDAMSVGLLEKKRAEQRLSDIAEAEKKLPEITDEEERKVAAEKLNSDKTKAHEDLIVAERVLSLAGSLEGNANDIENINKQANPNSYSQSGATKSTEPETQTTTQKTAAAKEIKTSPAKGRTLTAKSGSFAHQTPVSAVTDTGMVYKLQLGAFHLDPDLKVFENLGGVVVVSENSIFKVLLGTFMSREEATRKKDELKGKSQDCFVVCYKDGIRVH